MYVHVAEAGQIFCPATFFGCTILGLGELSFPRETCKEYYACALYV